MGNQASTGGKIIGHTLRDLDGGTLGLIPAVAGTLVGNTSGFKDVANSWKDFGGIIKSIGDPSNLNQALNGPSQDEKQQKQGTGAAPTPESESQTQADEQTQRDNTQYLPYTQTNHVVASNYSGQMGGFTRPSDLMMISDPNYKMMLASTRGKARKMAKQNGIALDLNMYQSLLDSSAGAGGGKMINSGGGIGPPLPVDAVSRGHLLPKVNANEPAYQG